VAAPDTARAIPCELDRGTVIAVACRLLENESCPFIYRLTLDPAVSTQLEGLHDLDCAMAAAMSTIPDRPLARSLAFFTGQNLDACRKILIGRSTREFLLRCPAEGWTIRKIVLKNWDRIAWIMFVSVFDEGCPVDVTVTCILLSRKLVKCLEELQPFGRVGNLHASVDVAD